MCARIKPGPGRGKAELRQFRVNEIMRCVAIDIFGPLPLTENRNEYIIVLGDYFSKWVDAWAVPNHTAQTVADKVVVEFSLNLVAQVKFVLTRVENFNLSYFA